MINHKEQEFFNVVVMSYKNSFVYVQKQIDRFLKLHRVYVKTYVNNIVIFSKTLKKHEQYFRQVFIILQINNISIKFEKVFLNYSSVQFLNQKVNFFDFATTKDKLKTISKLQFSRTFRQLEIYLNLTNWLREYISHYVEIVKSLQNRKTKLFRSNSIEKNARKTYSTRTRMLHFIE